MFRSRNTVVSIALLLGLPVLAAAQLEWRVSVKFILDADGARAPDCGTERATCTDTDTDCDFNTEQEIYDKVDEFNAILDSYGRGYRIRVIEILDVAGVAEWFDDVIDSTTRTALEAAAIADPDTYFWRDNAVNVYILGTNGSGTADDSILLGQNHAAPNTPLHELGHYFGLCHTHGCFNESPDCVSAGDDLVSDTVGDNSCADEGAWDWNEIAENAFPDDYPNLTAAQTAQVDDVYYNVMCYRECRERFTPDQLDRMTDYSNDSRRAVASGATRFVDGDGAAAGANGSSTDPYVTVADGLAAADGGDIVLVRAGNYDEPMTIDQRVCLRASRGSAVIGLP